MMDQERKKTLSKSQLLHLAERCAKVFRDADIGAMLLAFGPDRFEFSIATARRDPEIEALLKEVYLLDEQIEFVCLKSNGQVGVYLEDEAGSKVDGPADWPAEGGSV